ncbi:MAG: TRZ/ATZ family hydrolase [Pseudomonadota bacterium]|nr:TRZ/ATZ family hydrolase [Pseudomonadota bacterium]
MHADLLVHAQWILPVDAEERILVDHSLSASQGRIQAILPTTEARATVTAECELDLPGHVLIPGLINAHTHSPMTLLRGLADDLPLAVWLNEHIWPAESRWVGEEFVREGTRLALLEMLHGGTTCFNDMYFFPEITAKTAADAGMRAVVGLIIVDFPSAWAQNADDYIHRGLEVHDQLRGHPLIRTAFAPHAPYSVSDGPLQRMATLAEELDLPIHMHVHETRDEITQSLRDYGRRPLARLADLGLLSPRLVAVHMTQLEQDEIRELATCGAHVVHCPESNLKLASGTSPVEEFLIPAGVNCALGTDGAASNNDLDMIGEMRSAALLAKGETANASALPAHAVLRMATINGARAFGLEEETGSLEPGKSADLVAVDLNRPQTQPVYNPVSQLVYAAGRDQVRHVWVAGRQLIRDGQPTTLDAEAILEDAREWGARIAAAN